MALDKGKSKSIYFIGDDEEIPFRDFITAMLDTQDVPIPTKSIPRWLVSIDVKEVSVYRNGLKIVFMVR